MLKKLLMLAGGLALTLLAGRPATAQMLTLKLASDPAGISLVGSGTPTASMASQRASIRWHSACRGNNP